MPSNLTLDEIKKIQNNFDKKHQGKIPFYEKIDQNNIESLEHLIVCIIGEIGEFSNIVKKIKRGDFSLAEKQPYLNEELADIFIYLIKITSQLDVDLEKEFLKKLKKNKIKFQKFLK